MAEPTPLAVAVGGLCPRCGARTLFDGVIAFAERCSACGLDLTRYNVGDGPAALLTLVLGAIVVGLAVAIQLAWAPPLWVQMLIWIPVTAALVTGALRIAKAGLLALEYRNAAGEGRLKGMRRVPAVATTLVALAVAAMIALGVWQLQRLQQKEALLAVLAANPGLPPIALPRAYDQRALYRRTSAMCLRVTRIDHEGGHDATGRPGWRVIAWCATGAEGPGFAAQLGVTRDPKATPDWHGGTVPGTLASAPGHSALIASLTGHAPAPAQMIVADPPLAGLAANARPDLSSIPNNHLAYAVQWFLFAAVALVIYAVALRRRLRTPQGEKP